MSMKKWFFNKTKKPEYRKLEILGCLCIYTSLISHETNVKLFGYNLYKTKISKSQQYIEFTPLKLRFQKRRNIPVFNKVLKKISSKYDDIYICKHHIGEIYIFCQLLNEYIKINNSSRPVLIIPEKRYIPLYNMFCPDIDKVFVNLSMNKLDRQVVDDVTEYKKHRFFVPVPDRFMELRKLIFEDKDCSVHFYDYITKRMLGNNMPLAPCRPVIKDVVKEKARKRAKKLGLNLDKFVIFSPEAVTATDMSRTFWIELGKFFSSKGYQIYINTTIKEESETCWMEKIPDSVKDLAPFDEIYYLAQLSKGIVSLVNGLAVTFSQIDTPRFFIYTNQTPTLGERMDAGMMLNAYSVERIPYCSKSNLYEINLNEMCEKDVITFIEEKYMD